MHVSVRPLPALLIHHGPPGSNAAPVCPPALQHCALTQPRTSTPQWAPDTHNRSALVHAGAEHLSNFQVS